MTFWGLDVNQWNAIGTIASAAAALVVAWFGWVQLSRQSKESAAREVAAAARISATAYLLRQKLLSWPRSLGKSDRNFDDWILDVTRRRVVHQSSAAPLEYAREMMSLIGDAPRPVADKVRKIYVYLLAGLDQVQSLDPNHGNINDVADALSAAGEDFQECLRLLEDGVIEPLLLNEAAIRERIRDDQSLAGIIRKGIKEGAFDEPEKEEPPRND